MANVIKRAYHEYLHSDAVEQYVVPADDALHDMLKNKAVNIASRFSSKEIMQYAVLKTLQENEMIITAWLQSKEKGELHVQKDFLTKIGDGIVKGTDISKKYPFYNCCLTLSKKQNLVDFKIQNAVARPNRAINIVIKQDKHIFYQKMRSKKRKYK